MSSLFKIKTNPTIVIGLGGVLLSDEGVGIHLIRELSARQAEFPKTDFADLGTAGMRVLHAIAGRRKAIIIDCALMDEAPGVMRRFNPEQARTIKQLPGFSLHEGDLMQVLELSQMLGEAPAEVVIFGIQPADLSMGEQLSPTLQAKFPEYLAEIMRELA